MKKLQIKKPKMMAPSKTEPHIKVVMIILLIFILGFTIYYVYDINKSITTQESFLDSSSPVTQEEMQPKYKIILVYSNSCGYCSRFMPIFNEVTQSMNNIVVEKHLTGSPGSQQYMQHIQGVPFTIIEKNNVIISKKAGFMSNDELKLWLTTFVV